MLSPAINLTSGSVSNIYLFELVNYLKLDLILEVNIINIHFLSRMPKRHRNNQARPSLLKHLQQKKQREGFEGNFFLIDEILDTRTLLDGTQQVYVSWQGWPSRYNSWVEKETVKDVEEIQNEANIKIDAQEHQKQKENEKQEQNIIDKEDHFSQEQPNSVNNSRPKIKQDINQAKTKGKEKQKSAKKKKIQSKKQQKGPEKQKKIKKFDNESSSQIQKKAKKKEEKLNDKIQAVD